jgi:UDP-N-acetylmuramate dehydrogenase
MMAPKLQSERLVDRLPNVRGRYSENASLARVTWFRVGGPAEVMFRPTDARDLAVFLSAKPDDVPITVLGVGSNLLVRDGGVPGVVIRLGRGFARIETHGRQLQVGAMALDLNVARTAADAGLAGLEFLSGIPGTIGGALRMNAGAYGTEMKDVVTGVCALDERGRFHGIDSQSLGFSYRHCAVPGDWTFISAALRAEPGESEDILRRMEEIRTAREASQPLKSATGGSTFANPAGHKAWQLIDAAGCRGLRRGGAMVSEKHCNFLVNIGTATAADLEGLGEEVRRRVFETSGVRLDWEIRRIGVPATSGPGEVTS